jgi:translation elongation factor EF-G
MNIYLQEVFKMSEKAPHNYGEKFEPLNEHETSQTHERIKQIHENAPEKAEKSAEEIEKISQDAHHEAKSTEEMLHEANKGSTAKESEQPLITFELKEIAYQRLLKRARRHLPTYSRAMSKIIHQPAVDAVSEIVSKTVGRPSGIIGGGLMALVGTSIYYYLAKHYGYSYNSFVFLLLMSVGFVLGWCAEVIFKLLKRSPRN